MDGLNGNRHQRRNRNKIIMATWNVEINATTWEDANRKTQVEMVGGCA
jgi:hypothetical protein